MTFFYETGLPIMGLMALALGFPYLWALVLPEGIPGLALNFVLSSALISLVILVYFLTFYTGRNAGLTTDLVQQPGAFVPFFARWIGKASIAWAPMLIIGIAAQPKRWKVVVW